MKQRARVRWASKGDENSRYFHGLVNCRKASNGLPGLMINGVWVQKPSLIKKDIFNFFKKRFVEEVPVRPKIRCWNIKRISYEDKILLSETFSASEIKEAVFGCGEDRAPGPDGFNIKFIKHF